MIDEVCEEVAAAAIICKKTCGTCSRVELDGVRIWATRDWLHREDGWGVADLKLYGNDDCTGSNHNDGAPVESFHHGMNGPERAFDSNSDTFWLGGTNDAYDTYATSDTSDNDNDNDNEYWIGMMYESPTEIRCLSYLDYGDSNGNRGTKKFKIDRMERASGIWKEIMTVDVDGLPEETYGQRQNIALPLSPTSLSPDLSTSRPSLPPTLSTRPSNIREPTLHPTTSSRPSSPPTLSTRPSNIREPTSHPTTFVPTTTDIDHCGPDKIQFVLDLLTDDYGVDYSWRLEINTRGNYWHFYFRNGMPYDDNTMYHEEMCIPKNECFKFIISDAAGDGLCCTQSHGHYSISLDGTCR